MTSAEAKFLLQAYRAGGCDAASAEFAEALAQVRRDPVLQKWFEQELRADTLIGKKIQSRAVPAGLRADILLGARVSRRRDRNTVFRRRVLAAAVFLLVAIPGGIWLQQKRAEQFCGWQTEAIETVSELIAGKTNFDAESPRVEDLKTWLHAHGAPAPGALPAKLQPLASLGCKTVWWNDREISVVCFHLPDGGLVHLVTIDRTGLAGAPPLYKPKFAQRGEWATVSWSEDKIAVMVFTQNSPDTLRALLAALKQNTFWAAIFPACRQLDRS